MRWPSFAPTTTLAIVLGLALVQMVVHFRFFLHISLRESARDDLQLILFSTLIVILMVSGTLVILFNLRATDDVAVQSSGRRELADPFGGADCDHMDRQ